MAIVGVLKVIILSVEMSFQSWARKQSDETTLQNVKKKKKKNVTSQIC